MRAIEHLSFYISKAKILSVLTNKLVCLGNANNLLTANFEHSGSVMSAKHLSLYSVMAFTNISTSSKDASWIYWANAMMVLQQSTQSTQWWPAEFRFMSNQKLIGTPTCRLTSGNYQSVKVITFTTSWQFNCLIWILWLTLYLFFDMVYIYLHYFWEALIFLEDTR